MSEAKVLTREEIGNIIEEVASNTQIVGGEFMIVEGWDDVKALEEATSLEMDEIAKIVCGDTDNWGFSDEYTTCSDCGGLIKTSPNSYSWTPDFAIVNDCELLCGECIKANPQGYLEDLINNPSKANTILDSEDLEREGFKKLEENEYESGWYGKNDDPKKIFDNLSENYGEVIFEISSSGQFCTNFVCWVRSPRYNFPEYTEDINLDVFRDTVAKHIEELEINAEDYGNIITHQTLISSGAGQYAGKEFLELIGVNTSEIERAESEGFIYDLIDGGMKDISDDLKLYCDFNGVDLKGCSIWVGYNDNDGAVDVFLQLKED